MDAWANRLVDDVGCLNHIVPLAEDSVDDSLWVLQEVVDPFEKRSTGRKIEEGPLDLAGLGDWMQAEVEEMGIRLMSKNRND